MLKIVVSANTTIYAIWGRNIHTLTVTSSNNNFGTVNTTVADGMTGAAGTTVNVVASPKDGYVFNGWSNGTTTVSTDPSYTFTMPDKNVQLTAIFSFEITKITNINVLNVYGTEAYGEYVKTWMDEYGQGRINVTPLFIDTFNSDPTTYLGTASNWNYDVVIFGFSDCNGNKDLVSASASLVREFSNAGHGVIFGHDTMTTYCSGGHPYFNTLSDLVDLTIRDTNTYGDLSWHSTSTVRIAKEGIFTQYPYNIGSINQTLTIPYTHAMQFTPNGNGDIWLTMVTTAEEEAIPNSFFLASYKNNTLMMSGHTNGAATEDEQKIIANIIFYLYSYDLMHR